MLKMYHEAVGAGGSSAFWEAAWDDGRFEESVRYCEVDPLRPLFERHVRPGSTLLEGGCGRGNYVAYQSGRGVAAVGLDFATRTLAELHAREPALRLTAADVARLPVRSGSVDAYYSGGVVEHFEDGPSPALDEARRVLRTNGVFLVSVPYYNPLRRVLARVGRRGWRVVDHHAAEPPLAGRVFFQYVYTSAEFRRILTEHGFNVVDTKAYAVMWGLYELPLVGRLLSRVGKASMGATVGPTLEIDDADGSERSTDLPILKRLVVAEDTSVPVAGVGVRCLRYLAANMMMYVCVPSASAEGTPAVASR
jgi:SAM-dependent methyltransferase